MSDFTYEKKQYHSKALDNEYFIPTVKIWGDRITEPVRLTDLCINKEKVNE